MVCITSCTTLTRVGMEKGQWTLLKYLGCSKYLCRCRCGNLGRVLWTDLKHKKSRSCRSCSIKKAAGLASFRSVLRAYKYKAKARGRAWRLSDREFRKLSQMLCHYCGSAPSNVYKSSRHNGDFVYNGVDRKNNAYGYSHSNCVACCELCNWMKRDLSHTDFIKHCAKVSNRRKHGRL